MGEAIWLEMGAWTSFAGVGGAPDLSFCQEWREQEMCRGAIGEASERVSGERIWWWRELEL